MFFFYVLRETCSRETKFNIFAIDFCQLRRLIIALQVCMHSAYTCDLTSVILTSLMCAGILPFVLVTGFPAGLS